MLYTDPNAKFQAAGPGGPPSTGEQVPAGTSLDPQDQQTQPQPQQQGFGGRLMDSWNEFIDHPEHRAGLMQFAVNMLSGKGLGESIGAAAEATGRNVTAQEERERAEEAQDLKEREEARKEQETEYYGIGQKRAGGAEERYYNRLDAQEAMRARAQVGEKFYAWKQDETTPSSTWRQVQAKYPDLKGKKKSDMNPEQEAFARSLIARDLGVSGTTERSAARPQPEFKPPPGAVPRNVNGHKVWYDPKTGQAIPGQFGG